MCGGRRSFPLTLLVYFVVPISIVISSHWLFHQFNSCISADPPKQQKLPNEIMTTVENFKNFVKKQKSLSSEVMRVSIKPLHTVSNWLLHSTAN